MLATGEGRGASASTLKKSSSSTGSAAPTNSSPLLKYGMRGSQVKRLQTSLNNAGYNAGAVDGIFGNGTASAVKRFQKASGLSQDGVVGNNTWGALNSYHPSNVAKAHATHQITSAFNSQPKSTPQPKQSLPAKTLSNIGNPLGDFGNTAPISPAKTPKSPIYKSSPPTTSGGFSNPLTSGLANYASPTTSTPSSSQSLPGDILNNIGNPLGAFGGGSNSTTPVSPIYKKPTNGTQSQFNNLPGGLNYNPQNPYPYASQLPNTQTQTQTPTPTANNSSPSYTNPLTAPLQQLANANGTPSTLSGISNNGLPSGFGGTPSGTQANNGLPSGFGAGGTIGGATPAQTALGNGSGLSAQQLQAIQNLAPVTSATNDQNGTTGDLQKKWLQLMSQAQTGNVSNDPVLQSEIDAAKQAANSKYFQAFLKNRAKLAEHGMGNSGFVNDALVRSQLGEQQAIAKALPALINDRQNQILKQASEYGTMYKDTLPYNQMTASQAATHALDQQKLLDQQYNQAGIADINGQLTNTVAARKLLDQQLNQAGYANINGKYSPTVTGQRLTLDQQKFNETVKKDNATIAQAQQRIQNTAIGHTLTQLNDTRLAAATAMSEIVKQDTSILNKTPAQRAATKNGQAYNAAEQLYNSVLQQQQTLLQNPSAMNPASGTSSGN